MATWLKSDGDEVEVFPKHGKFFSLNELQSFVGGYIEMVPLEHNEYLMYCNEDGRSMGLQPNISASQMCNLNQLILGDVIILSKEEQEP